MMKATTSPQDKFARSRVLPDFFTFIPVALFSQKSSTILFGCYVFSFYRSNLNHQEKQIRERNIPLSNLIQYFIYMKKVITSTFFSRILK